MVRSKLMRLALKSFNTGNEGLFWLQRINEEYPDLSVVLITAYGDVELAVKALKQGAIDALRRHGVAESETVSAGK